jgi:hypothetical protein
MTSISALRRSIIASVMPFQKNESFPMSREAKAPFWPECSLKLYEKSTSSHKSLGEKSTRFGPVEPKRPSRKRGERLKKSKMIKGLPV